MLDRDVNGWLRPTAEFLKWYLARPEIVPPPDACAAERLLHRAALLSEPLASGQQSRMSDTVADADARENWHQFIAFRDQMSRSGSLEAAYIALLEGGRTLIFLDHLVQLILRNIFDQCDDAVVLRAAELFFRPQRMTLHEGSPPPWTENTLPEVGEFAPRRMLGPNTEVLSQENAVDYWRRSDRFDFALDLTARRRGGDALSVRYCSLMDWHLLADRG